MEERTFYEKVFGVVWIISFITAWVYAVYEYGYLLGVGLGWLPAIFVASIAAWAWPLLYILLWVGIVIYSGQ